jgi:hypothetical protein
MSEQLNAQTISDVMRSMGAKGGKARLKTMSKKQRSDSARKAAKARWKKTPKR